MSNTFVKLAQELELEVNKNNMEKLIDSHGELSNEDLIELQVAKKGKFQNPRLNQKVSQ